MTTSIVEIIRNAKQVEQATEQQTAAAKAKATKAEQAAADIKQAAADAVEAERLARANLGGQYMTAMRELTDAVAQARVQAAAAVRDGGDVLGLWLSYRRLRATNKGRWEALKYEYERATGHRPPPGNWGPPLRPDPDQTIPTETFGQFLHAVMVEAEQRIEGDEYSTTWDEITAAREQGK